MAKLFTLQEAEELIPSLEEWLPEAIDAKKQAVEADGEFQKIVTRIQLMGGVELNPAQVSRFKHVKATRCQEAAGRDGTDRGIRLRRQGPRHRPD